MLKDNRGFAITTVIFGVLVLFMLLLLSLLGMLSNYLNSLDILMDSVNGTRNMAIMKPICESSETIEELREKYIPGTSTDHTECMENVTSGLYCFGSEKNADDTCTNTTNCEYVARKKVCYR